MGDRIATGKRAGEPPGRKDRLPPTSPAKLRKQFLSHFLCAQSELLDVHQRLVAVPMHSDESATTGDCESHFHSLFQS
jgi:hypothetical protein